MPKEFPKDKSTTPGFHHEAWDIVWPRQRGVGSSWPFSTRNSSLQRLGEVAAVASGSHQQSWQHFFSGAKNRCDSTGLEESPHEVFVILQWFQWRHRTFSKNFCGFRSIPGIPWFLPLRSSMISKGNWSCSYQVFGSSRCRSGWKTSFLDKSCGWLFGI